MVIHETLGAAVQVHPLGEGLLTVKVDVPPLLLKNLEEGEIDAELQPPPPLALCVTVKVSPAMVIVPVRREPVFAATEYPTVPFPVPLPPEVIVIHVALLVAAHAQPAPAVTVTLPVPPLEPKDWLVGEIE
jgi:hypothetical protein